MPKDVWATIDDHLPGQNGRDKHIHQFLGSKSLNTNCQDFKACKNNLPSHHIQ